METKQITVNRFYKMDKALQLTEGTNVAALWAHLIDGYNYFEGKDMTANEYTIYQSSKIIQAFTGIGIKAQATARERLQELGFLNYKVGSKPGEATKSTYYKLFPDKYNNWALDHDYDKLRDAKYKELQKGDDKDRLDQWIANTSSDQDYPIDHLQNALGTFANHTQGHLQTIPKDICKTPKDNVIETIEVETLEVETKQTTEKGVVYSGEPYEYLKGKSKGDILELAIEEYSTQVRRNITDAQKYNEDRYIGSIANIEKIFIKFEIDVCVNCYIGILGYLRNLEITTLSNPKAFDTAYKFENLLKHKQEIVFSVANKKLGVPRYETIHRPKTQAEERTKEQSL